MKTVNFPRRVRSRASSVQSSQFRDGSGSAGVPPALAGVPPASRARQNDYDPVLWVRNRGPRRDASDSDRDGRAPQTTTSRDAVALVVTLIMLAVITFMAVTFLVLSRRDKGSVTTSTDQAVASFVKDSGFNRAMAEEIGRMLSAPPGATNDQLYGMLVSTNYINWLGFTHSTATAVSHNPTNVNYNYLRGGGTLSLQDRLDNIGNLMVEPRPPVFVPIGTNTARPDNRYYIDLNRNGSYDTNGYWPVMSGNKTDPFYQNGVLSTVPGDYSWFIGDPEWIGVLDRPDLPHSATNRFIGRYAYMVLPVGKELDLNYIHNQALQASGNQAFSSGNALTSDGYFRNQGVGTWEINLASFLNDLNTNYWNTYQYRRWGTDPTVDPRSYPVNQGVAFSDAYSLIAYRYNFNYGNLPLASVQLPSLGAPDIFPANGVDYYCDGPLLTGTRIIGPEIQTPPNRPWLGSDNPNHVYSSQDYFDVTKLAVNIPTFDFAGRLMNAGLQTNSYDRYTYYRMLSQLGTDGDSEVGKINVNYANTIVATPNARGPVTTVVVPGAEQNFQSWTPNTFFMATAQKLFDSSGMLWDSNSVPVLPNSPGAAVHPLGPMWIPIWPVNRYTPAVHRLLQLAANIYDATGQTNHLNLAYPQVPTVFRPIIRFDAASGQVVINGYREVNDTAGMLSWGFNGNTMLNLNNANDRSSLARVGSAVSASETAEKMVYGVPLIVGAKKGLPNFNELSASTLVSALRMLQFQCPGAPDTTAPITQTNMMYMIGVSNFLGIEAWNSYSNVYPRQLQVMAMADVSQVMTNEFGTIFLNSINSMYTNLTYGAGTWRGYPQSLPSQTASMQIPLYNNFTTLPISSYFLTRTPSIVTPWTTNFFDPANIRAPRWFLNLDVRLRFAILDSGRIVDYVNLDTGGKLYDLTSILATVNEAAKNDARNVVLPPTGNPPPNSVLLWDTNPASGGVNPNSMTMGVYNQIAVGDGTLSVQWNAYNQNPVAGGDPTKAQQGFFYNLYGRNNAGDQLPHTRQTVFYCPYVPYATVQFPSSWQVNDPLVHYTLADLTDLSKGTNAYFVSSGPGQATNLNLGSVNDRYEPWGGGPVAGSKSPTLYDLSAKDPGMRRSDDWDFPTNRLPNIGWLGRIHRGTPWQTVFMKATNILAGPPPGVTPLPNTPPIPRQSIWEQWVGNNKIIFIGNIPGNVGVHDSFFQAPSNDQKLFDIFTAVPSENAGRGRMSINQEGLAGWSAILGGVQVLSNSADLTTLQNLYFGGGGGAAGIPTINAPIPPAGPYLNTTNPAVLPSLVNIANAIYRVKTNMYSGTFTNLGNLLSVPELAEQSPFLDLAKPQNPGQAFPTSVGDPLKTQYQRGVNDEMMERIPQQIMGLVGLSHTPRMVVYVWGQSLRPAENSIIPNNANGHQGLCTNYQVTAEVAARAVVRVEGLNSIPPQPRVIVENYNVLPPDQ